MQSSIEITWKMIADMKLWFGSFWYPQDAKRRKAHELLEAETIKASVLRYRLAVFPHKLRAELSGMLHVDNIYSI